MSNWDVIVIDAGAAGLHCAAHAAKRYKSVLVLDHAKQAGKKILISGGGRCNFTNMYAAPITFCHPTRIFVSPRLAATPNGTLLG